MSNNYTNLFNNQIFRIFPLNLDMFHCISYLGNEFAANNFIEFLKENKAIVYFSITHSNKTPFDICIKLGK